MYICAHVCAACSFSDGEEDGVQLINENTCCLARGVIFDKGKIGVMSVSSLF